MRYVYFKYTYNTKNDQINYLGLRVKNCYMCSVHTEHQVLRHFHVLHHVMWAKTQKSNTSVTPTHSFEVPKRPLQHSNKQSQH